MIVKECDEIFINCPNCLIKFKSVWFACLIQFKSVWFTCFAFFAVHKNCFHALNNVNQTFIDVFCKLF